MQAVLDALTGTIAALEATGPNAIEKRQLQEASASVEVIRVSIASPHCRATPVGPPHNQRCQVLHRGAYRTPA
jgi:hypothetical protein